MVFKRESIAILSTKHVIFEMFNNNVVVGRSTSSYEADVDIGSSNFVSRQHLSLYNQSNQLFLICRGKNGIYINSEYHFSDDKAHLLESSCDIRFPNTDLYLYIMITKQNFNKFDRVIDAPNKDQIRINRKDKLFNLSSEICNFSEFVCKMPSSSRRKQILISKPSFKRSISPQNNSTSKDEFQSVEENSSHNIVCNSSNILQSALYESKEVIFLDHGDYQNKPPYSYAQLIGQAIASKTDRQITLAGIYEYMVQNYPYYRIANKGWQNSVRHNLSLNRHFIKVPRSQEDSGKGSFWRIDPLSEGKLIIGSFKRRKFRLTFTSNSDLCDKSQYECILAKF